MFIVGAFCACSVAMVIRMHAVGGRLVDTPQWASQSCGVPQLLLLVIYAPVGPFCYIGVSYGARLRAGTGLGAVRMHVSV